MKFICRFSLWILSAPAVVLALQAQNAGKQPVAVKVSTGDVTDNRTTGSFNSECKLELKFTGDAANDAATVRRVRVKSAVDELGRDLTRKDPQDSFGFSGSSQRSGVLKT